MPRILFLLTCQFSRLLAVVAAATLLAGPVLAEPFSRGLLWEISRAGKPKSYLFGTMHLADQRLLLLSPAVEKALDGARCFVMEMVPDDAAAQGFAEALELPAGERLSALLGEPAYAQLSDILAKRGMAAERVARIRPWAALLLLTEGQTATGHSLDMELLARASRQRKTRDGLESVEEQIAVFDDLPVATQVALLKATLRSYADLPRELERSIDAYLRGDLAQLMQLAGQLPGATEDEKQHLAMFEKKLIRDRNVVMAHRLQSSLRRCKTFAAVGALHLYGRHGLLQLLRDDGWTVRRKN